MIQARRQCSGSRRLALPVIRVQGTYRSDTKRGRAREPDRHANIFNRKTRNCCERLETAARPSRASRHPRPPGHDVIGGRSNARCIFTPSAQNNPWTSPAQATLLSQRFPSPSPRSFLCRCCAVGKLCRRTRGDETRNRNSNRIRTRTFDLNSEAD